MSKKEPINDYVLNRLNGEVFILTPILLKRADMIPCYKSTLAEAKAQAKREVEYAKRNTPESMQAVDQEEREAEDVLKRDSDPEVRMALIVNAISTLDPNNPEQYTAQGEPRTGAIELVIGDDVSAGERDRAFALYNAPDDQ